MISLLDSQCKFQMFTLFSGCHIGAQQQQQQQILSKIRNITNYISFPPQIACTSDVHQRGVCKFLRDI